MQRVGGAPPRGGRPRVAHNHHQPDSRKASSPNPSHGAQPATPGFWTFTFQNCKKKKKKSISVVLNHPVSGNLLCGPRIPTQHLK